MPVPSKEAILDIKEAIDRALVRPEDVLVGYMILAVSKVPSGGVRPMVAYNPVENYDYLCKQMRKYLDDPEAFDHVEWR
jgi:hypothetical protein